jgi:hypothetical protein
VILRRGVRGGAFRRAAAREGKEHIMRIGWKKAAMALGLTGALALSVPLTASAAPAIGGAGVKAAAQALPGATTDVRWRGNRGAAIVGGLAVGIIGAAAANAWGPRYYYGDPYYHRPYYYGAPYAYVGPRSYYGRPHWRHHRHWTHRHHRWHRR